MPSSNNKKGIFCIEGLWDHFDIANKSTVLPLLELLENQNYCEYIYHDCATVAEIEFFLDHWKLKKIQNKYPILYLAFHGAEGSIFLNHDNIYTLKQLAIVLKNKCHGKIIYFGSCSTLKIDKRLINKFLSITNAIATIGYKTDVDWIQSAACDLFVFESLQQYPFDIDGISNIKKRIETNYGNLPKLLDLRIVINEKTEFPG
jgi:hypothetical protein